MESKFPSRFPHPSDIDSNDTEKRIALGPLLKQRDSVSEGPSSAGPNEIIRSPFYRGPTEQAWPIGRKINFAMKFKPEPTMNIVCGSKYLF